MPQKGGDRCCQSKAPEHIHKHSAWPETHPVEPFYTRCGLPDIRNLPYSASFLLRASVSGLVRPTVVKGFVGLHGISSYCPEFVELSHHSANEMVLIQTSGGAYKQIGVKQNNTLQCTYNIS